MLHFKLLCAFVFASLAAAAPTNGNGSPPPIDGQSTYATTVSPTTSPTGTLSGSPTGIDTAPPEFSTVPPADPDPNFPGWSQDTTDDVQPTRGTEDGRFLGAVRLQEDNELLDRQNPDLLAPPTTDHGSVGSAKWPFSLSHNRLQTGGWARQQNIDVMPLAKALAGVNMRLEPGAIRELHWHSTAEWAYVLKGFTRITAVDQDGRVWVDTVGPGDLWYFPPGIPHSLQGTDGDPQGTEFLLVFDDGAFSEDETFLLTDWLAHVPREVLDKNFQLPSSAFDHIPSRELYIFPGHVPERGEPFPVGEAGLVPQPFTFNFSKVPATPLSGGTIKIADTRTFAVSKTVVAAEVTIEPGAMRELHWHPTEPEWTYFIQGEARITLFASSTNAATFDYRAGDIAYVPPSFGHYVENTGNETVRYLEIFNAPLVEDISLQQWLALTPPQLVKDHLGFNDTTIAHLNQTKQFVIGPAKN